MKELNWPKRSQFAWRETDLAEAPEDETLNELIVYTCLVMILAAGLGWRFAKSAVWKYVDLLYYPLGALGAILLFTSATSQREISELGLSVDAKKSELAKLVERRSQTSRNIDEMVVKQFLKNLQLLDLYLWQCRSDSNPPPLCTSGPKIVPLANAFLKSTENTNKLEPERWEAQVCSRVDAFLRDVQAKGALSPLVADELLVYYREGIEKRLPDIWSAAEEFSKQFEARIADKIIKLQTGQPRISTRQIAVLKADAKFGVTILSALGPCIVQSRAVAWIQQKDALEAAIQEVEGRIKIIREDYRDESPVLSFLRLWIWPYVINLALALKLAKAVATLRPSPNLLARSISATSPATPAVTANPAVPLSHKSLSPLRARGFRDKAISDGGRNVGTQ